jgi:putative NADH-flavin reductase
MEDEMRQSGLDWTIVRPPRLTDKPPTGRYRTALNRNVRGGYTISRADLAAAILKLLDDPASIRAAIGIGY